MEPEIHFTGHQLDVTPALKTFTQEKLQKVIRHFQRITRINIIFTVEKLRNIVEATIHVPRESIHASSEAESMYSAIDELVEKLDKQIKRRKEKDTDHRE